MKYPLTVLLLLCACGQDPSTVYVELRTDLVAGIEFDRIEVLRFSEDGTELLRQETRRVGDRDFLQGSQIATLQGADGDWLLEVRLRDAMDGLVVTQPVLVTVRGDTLVTALISRECRDVACPAALGNLSHTACLAGECVSPRCTLESPEECGSPQCDSDESCGSVECGDVQCLDGYCFASSGTEAAECDEDQYCDTYQGCRGIPTGADTDRDRWNDFEDCDDNDSRVHPGAAELCNGLDDDCDGEVDEGLPGEPFFRDADEDGFGSFINFVTTCAAPEGYVDVNGDCNDGNATIFPGATEICDGIDSDCDGVSDDQDGDGHSVDCEGGTFPADDCNDRDFRIFPTAPERCDSLDNDCDVLVDEAEDGWFRDSDGDGYGLTPVVRCAADSVDNGLDCDDTRPEVNPAAPSDPCGDGDRDCDTLIDEDPELVWYVDTDGDGVGIPGESVIACMQPDGYGTTDLDCDDEDPTTAPGFAELCDGVDNDCDPATLDDSTLCDPSTLIEVLIDPSGVAWDQSDVQVHVANRADASGTLECRSGKVQLDGTMAGEFVACPETAFTPALDVASTGDGVYRTQVRLRLDSGGVTSPLDLDYYLHASLVGAPDCSEVDDIPAIQFFERASERLQTVDGDGNELRFSTTGDPSNPGFAAIGSPFIHVNFTPRLNRHFSFQVPGPGAGSWVATEGELNVLSLRRRFVMNEDQSMILISRRYGSRRGSPGGCVTLRVNIRRGSEDRSGITYQCDALVLNREGAGVCLRVEAGGVIEFARNPAPTVFNILMSALMPPDEALTDGVDNSLWRKLGARHSPNTESPVDRATCTFRAGGCSELGISGKWGWRQFSPKCFGEPNCVDTLRALQLHGSSMGGAAPLYLPDDELFRF